MSSWLSGRRKSSTPCCDPTRVKENASLGNPQMKFNLRKTMPLRHDAVRSSSDYYRGGKYGLGVALNFAAAQWLQCKDNMDKTEMGYLVAPAHLLEDMEMSIKSTLPLILDYEGSSLLGVSRERDDKPDRTPAEQSGANHKKNYKLIQINYRLPKTLEVLLLQIIAGIEAVSYEDIARKYHSGIYRCYYHEAPTYSKTLAGKPDAIKKSVGICLDCARSGAVM
ncbi:hypothetical protein jhhlp_007756 [Lomentospora prolificans]|uniref:Uncharacterized protein n=1 Tax=Lomentospora prolificans TaxID=41688 RepID=A0A2N3N0H1_9PEZI|nr:hypothetical protein jhhlp_007756 [Lomentospora prolificans]